MSVELPRDPESFIALLRDFQAAGASGRGHMANALSDAILRKHVDLAEVRRQLIDSGEIELYDTLERLMDLIEPYLMENEDME